MGITDGRTFESVEEAARPRCASGRRTCGSAYPRLLAVKKLRSDFFVFDDIKRALGRASTEQVEAWARAADFRGRLEAIDARAAAAARAAGATAKSGAGSTVAAPRAEPAAPASASAPGAAASAGSITAPPPPKPPSYPCERWERIVLLPGLELSVQDQPALRRIAAEVYEHYGSKPRGHGVRPDGASPPTSGGGTAASV